MSASSIDTANNWAWAEPQPAAPVTDRPEPYRVTVSAGERMVEISGSDPDRLAVLAASILPDMIGGLPARSAL